MNCYLKQCQWNVFDEVCCPESEEIYKSVIPSNTECPSFYDLHSELEKDRLAYAASLFEILDVVKLHCKDQLREDILKMDSRQLLDIGDKLESLYASHLECEAMDRMLDETKELGIEKFKEKYNLTSLKKEEANEQRD
ncbi:hypothetical protein EEL31_08765 [Brevibacillus laterosporus]|nr:hypothetical protein [Brevibacillus laterosporus]TPG68601.1 hypothetical protein EEL31_08765 [Brevibacillus laterosporus]